MIVCNLSKPESTLDQVKKAYPKLQTTDAGLLASSLVIAGREAQAVYEGGSYTWPADINDLCKALLRQLSMLQEEQAPVKKTKAAMAALEEEAVEVKVGLTANYAHAEKLLGTRDDLKTLFSDILNGNIEYQYTAQDIGWQWALDRVNWTTVSGGDLTRRVRLKATFQGDVVGTEMGLTKKRVTRKAKPLAEDEATEATESTEAAEAAE